MLKQILQQEHLIDYVWNIINHKEVFYIHNKLDKIAELFNDCIFISNDEYEEQSNATVYDKYGNELLIINDVFVNQYSNEDYLNNIELYNQLNNILKEINRCEKLIVFS